MGNVPSKKEVQQGPPQEVLDAYTKLVFIEGYIRSIALCETVADITQMISQYFEQHEDLGLKIGMKGKLVLASNVWTQYLPQTGEMRVSHSVDPSTQFIVTDTYTIPHHESNFILIQVILTKSYSSSFPLIAKRFTQNNTKCYIKYESTNLYKPRARDIAIHNLIQERKSNHDGLIKCKLANGSIHGTIPLWNDHRGLKKISIDKNALKNGDEAILIAPDLLELKSYSRVYIYIPKLKIYGWTNFHSTNLTTAVYKERNKLNKNKYTSDYLDETNDPIHVYASGYHQKHLYSDPYNYDLTGKTICSYHYIYKLRLLSNEVKYGMIHVKDDEKGRWGDWYNVPVWIKLESVKYVDKIKYNDKRKVDDIFIYDYSRKVDDNIMKGTKGLIVESHTVGYINLDLPITTYSSYCNYSKNNRFEVVSNGYVQGKGNRNYYIQIKLISNEYNSNVDFEALQKETWIPLHCTNLYKTNAYLIECMRIIKEFQLLLQNDSDIKDCLHDNNYTKSYVHRVTLLNADYYGSKIKSDVQYTAILDLREEFYLIAPKIDNVQFGDRICVYSLKKHALGWVNCNDTGLKRYSNEEGDAVNVMPRIQTYASVDPLVPLMPYEQHYAKVIVLNEEQIVNSVTYRKVQGETPESPMYKEWFWVKTHFVMM